MLIIPAIDLLAGQVVRLRQGMESSAVVYSEKPVETAGIFQEEGARLIHVVDLDGAFGRPGVNDGVIQSMADSLSIPIELGGGIRSMDRIGYWLNRGISRVILGSAAVNNPEMMDKAIRQYSSRSVIAAVDLRNGKVSIQGWQEDTELDGLDLAMDLKSAGLSQIIITEISTDGMLTGPRLDTMIRIAQKTGLDIIASGGIRSIADLKEVAGNAHHGIRGVIIGKAVYENNLSVREAVLQYQKEEDWKW
ncbi:1-(5-phosphoribosyl)-5-[(5-phosphoribosylamino)methylideneamino]imidazole-4-carboxamide isomerase [bacterium]